MTGGVEAPRVKLRADLSIVADMVEGGSRVLDLGCGDGTLLDHLVHRKNVDGRGIELRQAGVNACVSRGLSVIQGDVDKDLEVYPDDSFDYVILTLTLPAVHRPKEVLGELLRIGRRAVVSFPNFGFWRRRLCAAMGRVPVTDPMRHRWHDSPDIHPCTIKDFVRLCEDLAYVIERRVVLDRDGGVAGLIGRGPLANLFGETAIFLLRKT